jgi:TM2 domain-containing membrane protein YozV/glutaredoxin
MPIPVACPSCAARFKAPDNLAGRTVKCPQCKGSIAIPIPLPQQAVQSATASPLPDLLTSQQTPPPPPVVATKECPFCSEQVMVMAKKCKHCGEIIDVALRAAEEARKAADRGSHAPQVFMNAGGGSSSAASSAAAASGSALDGLPEATKSRWVAALLAIFLGLFGVHKFYLGQAGQGILYLIFCWTAIPFFLGIIDGISFLGMSDRKFAQQYG